MESSSSSSLNGGAARESGAAIGSSPCRHVGRLATSYDGKDDRATVVVRTVRSRCLYDPSGCPRLSG